MAQYIIVYIGGNQPASEEEGKQHMARYKAWLEGLGDAVLSPATPFGNTRTIGADRSVAEGSSAGISGYTTVQAESIDAAVAIARDCPFLDLGGTLEVAELMSMPQF